MPNFSLYFRRSARNSSRAASESRTRPKPWLRQVQWLVEFTSTRWRRGIRGTENRPEQGARQGGGRPRDHVRHFSRMSGTFSPAPSPPSSSRRALHRIVQRDADHVRRLLRLLLDSTPTSTPTPTLAAAAPGEEDTGPQPRSQLSGRPVSPTHSTHFTICITRGHYRGSFTTRDGRKLRHSTQRYSSFPYRLPIGGAQRVRSAAC